MKIKELERRLKDGGCEFYKHGGNHDWWINTKTGAKFQVPRHSTMEVYKELLKSIEKQSGVKLV